VRAEATRAHEQHSIDGEAPRFRVTTDMILRAAVGMKDQTKALYDVLGAIFRKPDMRLRASQMALSEAPASTDIGDGFDINTHTARRELAANAASAVRSAHFSALLTQLSSYTSEPRLLLAGLHENMLRARIIDPSLLHTWAALDWLCAGSEIAERSTNQVRGRLSAGFRRHDLTKLSAFEFIPCLQAFAVSKFVAIAGLGVHLHLASDLKQKIEWPRNDGAMRSKMEQRTHVVQVRRSGCSSISGGVLCVHDALTYAL
jgi:hypothetical protein